MKQLQDVCHIIRGASPRPKSDPRFFGGEIPWIKISDVTKAKGKYLFFTKESVTEEGKKKSVFLLPETLIVTNSATVGIPKILKIAGCIHDGFLAIKNLSEEVDRDYLYYYLLSIREHLNRIAPKGTQKNLNINIANKIEVLIPPLLIQKKIVSILDLASTLKEKRTNANLMTDKILQAIYFKMFGDPFIDTKFDMQKIMDLTSLVSYGFTRPMPHFDIGIPIITSKNVRVGKIDFDNVDYTDTQSFAELSKKDCPKKGDILYTKDGRIGVAAAVKTDTRFCISQAVAILRPLKEKIDPIFFETLLNTTLFRNKVRGMAYGVALKHISITKLKQLSIATPSLKLQKKFVTIVKKIDEIRKKQEASKDTLNELYAAITSKAFKGEFLK